MKTIREIIGKREKYSVPPDLTVQDVVLFLCERRMGAVGVCEGDKVVGVFSERDLLRRVVHQGIDPATTTVSEVMTRDVYHVSIDERCDLAQAIMLDKNFRHLAVLDGEDRFMGFVSMRELLEADLADSKDLIARLNDGYYQHEFVTPDDRTKAERRQNSVHLEDAD